MALDYRRAKLERLRARGVDPYPPRFRRSHTAAQAVALFAQYGATEAERCHGITVAGRLMALRRMGRATFADVRDDSGRLQLHFRQDALGEARYAEFDDFDLGDFIGASGDLFVTRSGELTLEVHEFAMLAKALQQLPEKWHGLRDVEARYRQRYLDLMFNDEVRQTFEVRSRVIAATRRYLDERGFLGVETPVLWNTAGGALARRFVTHYNALDRDLYLRIATELHLKRLLVGGFERIYELGRIFRNEGVSTKHNPEFTSLEVYAAYTDYQDMMALVEDMVATVAREVLGTTEVASEEQTIRLDPPWRRLTLRDAILEHTGIDFEAHPDAESLRGAIRAAGLSLDLARSRGKLIDDLLTAYVEPRLLQPTFLTDYPVELTPLAKRVPGSDTLVERFEGFIRGLEVANAFTELNDPLEQRARFAAQRRELAAGDEETEMLDEDFLVAMEYGMPPAGGLGVGIDRLVMVLTDSPSIRDVILFPQLRSRDT